MFEALAAELEIDFRLVGCSAIEDKLQDRVPGTIARLARAKIRLWVLTGDKQETAIEIGRSTNLIVPSMEVHILNCLTEPELMTAMDQALEQIKVQFDVPHALIIDGSTLNLVMEGDRRSRLITKVPARKFTQLAFKCRSVVVCRSSPLQKALIVMLVRKFMPGTISLSIGDGANDVPMIRAANIGIGIAGLEGLTLGDPLSRASPPRPDF